jgi:hypothetical protein
MRTARAKSSKPVKNRTKHATIKTIEATPFSGSAENVTGNAPETDLVE